MFKDLGEVFAGGAIGSHSDLVEAPLLHLIPGIDADGGTFLTSIICAEVDCSPISEQEVFEGVALHLFAEVLELLFPVNSGGFCHDPVERRGYFNIWDRETILLR